MGESIVDDIIDGFLSGDPERQRQAELRYEGWFELEHVQNAADHLGLVVPHRCVEFDPENLDFIEDKFSLARLQALRDGAVPTEAEKELYKQVILDASDSMDADVVPGYWIQKLEHSEGRTIYSCVTVTGYSFSGISAKCRGLFASVEDAVEDLQQLGIVVPC